MQCGGIILFPSQHLIRFLVETLQVSTIGWLAIDRLRFGTDLYSPTTPTNSKAWLKFEDVSPVSQMGNKRPRDAFVSWEHGLSSQSDQISKVLHLRVNAIHCPIWTRAVRVWVSETGLRYSTEEGYLPLSRHSLQITRLILDIRVLTFSKLWNWWRAVSSIASFGKCIWYGTCHWRWHKSQSFFFIWKRHTSRLSSVEWIFSTAEIQQVTRAAVWPVD